MAHGLEKIDWAAPWLQPWRDPGQRLATQVQAGCSVAQALNGEPTAPRQFVAQEQLTPGVAYEEFIALHGKVPTRDNVHDFFNGLAWLRFPRTKARLNTLQAAHIAACGVGPVRGALRDALTLFDENTALLQAPDALWDALCQKQWDRVFGTLRPLWAQSQLTLFGHALTEKLLAPRKGITAHVYRVLEPSRHPDAVDAWLARALQPEQLVCKPFAHLPVLGVPGWWPHNTAPGFYADRAVFRISSNKL